MDTSIGKTHATHDGDVERGPPESTMDKRRDPKAQRPAPEQAEPAPLDEEALEEGEEGEDDDELAPTVIVGRFGDLRGFADAALVKKYAERPVWFLIEDDADLVELFVRHPEKPAPRATAETLLSVLRSFAAAESEALQALLGPTDQIGFGYHENASFDDVVASFEDDGFEVAFALYEGKVVPEEEDDE
ncbi:hypothetical protein [Polyangium jinanense]|uniref:Uncharacterized protein n=1 Tax=Polyangium jinanense TaxID=2829994 RepID=A0A9X3X855_9BACT|nr:hypothetical protein [Polyangium jinanense]MDC3985704.1 hypothetical protein [Polyangium jinanense]